ncbi:SDR family oxidoreductase [Bradyrhizobium sp. WSM1743]|uniref:SDR family oxidoreductase n=1 Tax=Bradyrhizobium sp. WSM1743 TaxID=318996 RepID=UPI000485CB4F|nr:SDR family oxidoreductase [Bradyrhizobium sp. WSM1743]
MTSAGRVVVVTGATAGVGRAVALAFARRRWNVALIARDHDGLENARHEVEEAGGAALTIAADVADADALFAAADRIVREWQGIDVWVNSAIATIYAPIWDVTPTEFRRATEVTYLGYVFGTLAALRHMRRRNSGTIVQVGSALSYRAIPLQAPYCGAKFAVRGFTDALRCELRHERSGVRVTMVQLPAVNTPQFDWGRNKLGFYTQPLPPIYQPEAIAEAIQWASRESPREVWVGFSSLKAIIGNMIFPGLLDNILKRRGYRDQITSKPIPADAPDNLFAAVSGRHTTHGRFDSQARANVSFFNAASIRITLAVAALVIAISATVGAADLFQLIVR